MSYRTVYMGKKLLKDLAEQLLEKNIITSVDVVHNFENEPLVINVPGFYKSNGAQLVIDGDKVVAITRYGQVDIITCISDLVYLNFQWWQKSTQKDSELWNAPDHRWSALLLETGLVIKETKEIYSVSGK